MMSHFTNELISSPYFIAKHLGISSVEIVSLKFHYITITNRNFKKKYYVVNSNDSICVSLYVMWLDVKQNQADELAQIYNMKL